MYDGYMVDYLKKRLEKLTKKRDELNQEIEELEVFIDNQVINEEEAAHVKREYGTCY